MAFLRRPAFIPAAFLALALVMGLPGPTMASDPDDAGWPVLYGNAGRTSSTGHTVGPGSGELIWRVPMGPVRAAPAVVGETVYVGSHDRHTYAMDARTGAVRWRVETGVVDSGPVASRDAVYVTSGELGMDGHLYALDATTGHLLWRAWLHGARFCSPSLAGDRVLIGTPEAVRAFSASNGAALWTFALPQDYWGDAPTSPLVFGGLAVFAYAANAYAVDVQDGSLRWKFSLDEWEEWGAVPPASDGTRAFLIDDEGVLYALDREDGALLWSRPTSNGFSLSVDGPRLYIGGPERFEVWDAATGRTLWSGGRSGAPTPHLAVTESALFSLGLSLAGTTVVALDANDGALIWKSVAWEWEPYPNAMEWGVPASEEVTFSFYGESGVLADAKFSLESPDGRRITPGVDGPEAFLATVLDSDWSDVALITLEAPMNGTWRTEWTGVPNDAYIGAEASAVLSSGDEVTLDHVEPGELGMPSVVVVDGLAFVGTEASGFQAFDAGAGIEPLPSARDEQRPAPKLLSAGGFAALIGAVIVMGTAARRMR